MTFASLTLSGWTWLWPAVAVVVLAAAFLFAAYRRAPVGGVRWACFALKALGIAALAFCLIEPLWTGQRVKPGANLFAVVADNSQGMQIKDAGAARSRGEQLQALLDVNNTGWQSTLAADFDLRRYLFDARLQNARDFRELVFDGRSSAIHSALKTLGERFNGRPLAGVLLLTDGNATDLTGTPPDLAGLPPIYPVVIGGREPARDIALQQVAVSQTAFEDAPVSVQAEVVASGYPGESIVARVFDQAGEKVEEQFQSAPAGGQPITFRFQLRPKQSGIVFYQLRVGAADEVAGVRTNSTEATLANNQRVMVVDRGRDEYRILYVSGRPNWEFKFMNRALTEDKQVHLVSLIRVAKREPKFDFRGRAGETSNPLFRGFGDQSREGTERYDQPVLIRLNTKDELELRSGFPRTPEDLYGYHAVIVDDLEAEFFAPDQAAVLQKFVSERGGGFLMLGGMESFQQGQYHRTSIGDMLPVYLDRVPEAKADQQLRLQLSREGWLQPWARLRDTEPAEKLRLEAMPPFQVMNPVRDVKPGASVIATAVNAAGEELPALAVQRFGRGRSAALMLGDLWRWGMRDDASQADLGKAWRQLVRWLVADVPNRVELAVEPVEGDPNGAVKLQVRSRDAKFQPLDNAAVSIAVEPAGFAGTTNPPVAGLRLLAEPSLEEPGLYQATYVPRLTGGFKATAYVTNSVGAEVGRAEAGWSTDLAADEFRSLTPNVALLEDLARRTGGEVVPADKLDEFVKTLPLRKAPVMEAWSYPVWHTPLLFAFALCCLVGEWGLRRWKGLP